MAAINGLPGFITLEPDGQVQTTALAIEDGRIAAIYVMRNPDKLRHLDSIAAIYVKFARSSMAQANFNRRTLAIH